MGIGRPARPFGRALVEAPTAAQAADFDRFAIQKRGVPEAALMETAGREAAQIIHHLFPEGPVVGLVGAGNNGGDALVCLRSLATWGRSVVAVLAADRPPDGLLHDWPIRMGTPDALGTSLEALAAGAVAVDGILGTGISGPPRPRQAQLIEELNGSGARAVVALDAPSGVDGDTGEVPGAVVDADLTVAFGWPKLGTMLRPGRAHVGRLVGVEIGFPPVDDRGWARLITPGWAADRLPRRAAETHKVQVGALCLVAGSVMAGAAILATRSAYRAGAGLVRVCCHPSCREALLAACPEALWVDGSDARAVEEAVAASRAVAAGPGLGTGPEAAALLEAALKAVEDQLVVLDADALTLIAPGGVGAPGHDLSAPVLATPHPGEMARLAGTEVDDVQADRIGTARAVAAERGWSVLLKGAPSVLADPEGGLLVEIQGSSDLAVGGMGDVLTGTAGALAAQGVDVTTAGALALHITGRAARLAGRGVALTPSDVIESMPDALAEAVPAQGDLPFPFVIFDQALPG